MSARGIRSLATAALPRARRRHNVIGAHQKQGQIFTAASSLTSADMLAMARRASRPRHRAR